MKNTIFTYCNFQVDPRIAENQTKVINKIREGTGIDFNPLTYKLKDGEWFPNQCINYGLHTLFFEKGYDNVLILDIDCIPLSRYALNYTFFKATCGYLIGDVQRSLHLQNNEHLFVGSSCLCINREMYEKIGRVSADCTNRGDICEEFTYIYEQNNLPIELYVPQSYESKPYGIDEWPLSGDLKPYGIGTTFEHRETHEPMFYHLFESRLNQNVERFVRKCEQVLE